jgi:subtilisin family serine protease
MAGVIASKNQLLGIAPQVSILSAQAFAPPKAGSSASGTTFAIIKSMDWAYKSGARVYNMSFAGPKDPVLIRALDALAEYNTIMIAAAGNAGPGKPPAYPAAHKGVIAVTATDENDGLYTMANRGAYVAVAAPGVDILTTTPGEGYEFMSGTSIATAHVTGVVALVLERHPNLKADAIAQLLANASVDLGKRGVDAEFGAGLVDAVKALESGNALAKISTGGLTARQ